MLLFIRKIWTVKYWPSRILIGFLLFLCLDWLFPLPAEKSYSKVILAADGSLLDAFLTEDEKWRMRSHLEEVSPDLIEAIIAKEDRWFWQHPGVNPVALGRAAFNNLVTGRRTSGASTITMQLARMMEPKSRTLWSKFKEMFRAFQLEWHYSKEEILERYLSYLPYGGNVEGVKAASYIYFNRPPAALSLAQATLLTVIPNRPNSLRLDRHPEAAQRARDKWLYRFKREGQFPAEQVRTAIDEPISAKRFEIIPQAPHFCLEVSRRNAQREVHTTLDAELQATVEILLSNYINRIRHKGISNGAVLVIDNRNSAVVAYCGSADFYDAASDGQVDGVRSVRSPGSTLKASLYAMAMDRGLYTPDSRLLDVPGNFAGYSPENYDLTYRGAVSLQDALRYSLNIPPVRVLREMGLNPYLDMLEAAGFESIRKQREQLGLSVILGGCGVTLEELTRLFSAFAREGRLHPLAFTQKEAQKETSGLPIFSEESAWLIADILSGIERPDLPNDLIGSTGKAQISWKTGTSYGRRDAWSIGFTPRYTVGVWAGNFDGKGVADLSGTTVAVPLLFEVFEAIDPQPEETGFLPPHSLRKRKICAETGELPSEHCPRISQGWYIPDVSPNRICDQERKLYINADSTVQYCTECLPEEGYAQAVYPIYPAELVLWWRNNEVPFLEAPPHFADCPGRFGGEGPRIISPASDFEYLIEEGGQNEILLQAASDARVNRHSWYVDGVFIGNVEPGEKLFFKPKPGTVRISCMDDKGRESRLEITVKSY